MGSKLSFSLIVLILLVGACGGGSGDTDCTNNADCPSGVCNDQGICEECTSACDTLGERKCENGELHVCEMVTAQCNSWSAPQVCAAGCESETSCKACEDECAAEGEQSCLAGEMVTCTENALGCLINEREFACASGMCTPDNSQCQAINNGMPEVVDSANSPGEESSIQVDSAGMPHIAYSAAGSHKALRYTRWVGAQWQTETVDGLGMNSPSVGYSPSLALDSNNRPHIAHVAILEKELRYAHYDGSAWQQDHDIGLNSGTHCAIALDSGDEPVIAYSTWYDSYLQIIRPGANGWDNEQVSYSGWPWQKAWFMGLALDSQDNIHISAYAANGGGPTVYVGWTPSSNWDADGVKNHGWHTDITIDQNEEPHLTFEYRSSPNYVYYAYYDGLDWQDEEVASSAKSPAIEVAADGMVYIAYYDRAAQDLRLATRDLNGLWTNELLDDGGTGDVGVNPDMAIDHFGNLHISYYDRSNGQLKYIMVTP